MWASIRTVGSTIEWGGGPLMDVLNLDSMIYHFIRKTILSGEIHPA